MKKPKFKLDGATIQKLLVLHCEKLVLVVVLGIMAWLVYMGYSLPGLDADKTPVALARKSDETKKFIDDAQRWTAVVSEKRILPLDLVEKTGEGQTPSDPSKYPVLMPWKPEMFPKLSPRTDPKLLPPQHLIVHPVMGPLFSVFASEEEVDPTYPPIVDPDDSKPKKTKPKKKRGAPGDMYAGGYPGGSAYPGDTGSADGGSGSGYSGSSGGGYGRAARRSSRRSGGSEGPSQEDSGLGQLGPGMGGSMGSGMGGYAGMEGYGAPGMGGINPESIRGFQGNAQSGIGRHAAAMVVTAVVPYEKQLEEFANALNSSLDYDLQRDQPVYLGFAVERAEVPADNLEADPALLQWARINVKAAKIEQLGDPTPPGRWGQWAGVLTEVSDPAYLDANLTYPAPPFMQRDIWPLVTHPDVPLMPLASAMGTYEGTMRPPVSGGAGAAADKPVEDVPTIPGAMPGMSGAYGGSSDGGYGGMPGALGPMGSAMGGSMGPSRGMPGGMSMGGMSGYSGGSSAGGYGGSSMGGYGGSGYGGYGGYGEGGAGMTFAPPKYKLVRFTDTHVEEGKHYRYRLKVQLHDPNHPWITLPAPTLASLHEDVRARIRALDAEDAKKTTDPARPQRTFWIESDWSEPSDVVSLPSRSSFFAGSVKQPSASEIVPDKPRIANSQPEVKVLTSVWDPVKAVDVPAEETAYRGSTLNFTKDTKVIHPINHDPVDYKEYKFQTGGVVADLMGGEPIPKKNRSSTADPLTAPGELLIFDAQGNLRVRDEAEDIEEFRRQLVPEPDTKSLPAGAPGSDPYAAGGSDAPGYGGSGGSAYPGSSGYPGMGGRGSRGSRGSGSSRP